MTETFDNTVSATIAMSAMRAMRAAGAASPVPVVAHTRAELKAAHTGLGDGVEDVHEGCRGEALLAVAGRVGITRLIDNVPVNVGPGGGALEVFFEGAGRDNGTTDSLSPQS